MKFLENIKSTNAEQFPTKIQFTLRDYFAMLLIPLIFINGYVFNALFTDKYTVALGDTIGRGVLFIIICILYYQMLKLHWHNFLHAKWSSWIIVLLGAVLLQIIIAVVRSFLPVRGLDIAKTEEETNPAVNFTLLIISLGPIFTALIEDIVFRYTFLQKLFIPNTLWRVVVVLLNSMVFGLIHYYNFNGNVMATISFMAAALFLNLVYLWTKNIWHVLLIHALNNFVLSTLGIIFLFFVQLFTSN